MQQRQLVSGFSELKDLIIRKYNITEERNKIRLHFTMDGGMLVLHNYKQHIQKIILAEVMPHRPSIRIPENSIARQLIELALKQDRPAQFLNHQFKLHGFFRF